MRTKAPKVDKRLVGNAAYRAQVPLPVVLLGIDPGRTSGYAIYDGTSNEMISLGSVDVYTTALDDVVTEAIDFAIDSDCRIYMVAESWGAGGNRGLDQWLGLGETRGMWKRAFHLALWSRGAVNDDMDLSNADHTFQVHMGTWRSKMIDKTIASIPKVKGSRSEGWKLEARRVVSAEYPEWPQRARMSTDACEAGLMTSYAIRGDELRERLSPRYLSRFTWDPEAGRYLRND